MDSLRISIPVGGFYFCGRALQSPITSASGDDSIGVWRRLLQGRMEHVFCEIGILGAESGQEIEQSLKGFFPNLG